MKGNEREKYATKARLCVMAYIMLKCLVHDRQFLRQIKRKCPSYKACALYWTIFSLASVLRFHAMRLLLLMP